MKSTFAGLALATVALATPVPQDSYEVPSSFKITNVISGGSGCPQGSIDVNWTDSKVLPIRFSKDFTARVGPNVDITDSRKFCQLNLALSYSAGFSFAVFQSDVTGWADLDAGVTGTVKSTYYVSGETDQTTSTLTFDGPTKGKYTKSDKIPLVKWSPCTGGQTLFNVNVEAALTPFATSASGTLAATRANDRLTNNIYIQWKKC